MPIDGRVVVSGVFHSMPLEVGQVWLDFECCRWLGGTITLIIGKGFRVFAYHWRRVAIQNGSVGVRIIADIRSQRHPVRRLALTKEPWIHGWQTVTQRWKGDWLCKRIYALVNLPALLVCPADDGKERMKRSV